MPMEDLVEQLQKAIEVTPVQPMAETKADNLPGFFVNVTLDNARTAQQVCTAVTSMFIEENLKLRQEHSEDTTQFLSQQLADAKANLDAQDGKLAAFKSRYLGSLPDNEQTNLNLLTGLTSQLDAATQALDVQGAIGYMPQRFGLYEDLTVQENLDLYADLQGVPEAARAARYAELMHMAGLAPFSKRLAGKLSGGMKQKLGLACALVRQPALLMLD